MAPLANPADGSGSASCGPVQARLGQVTTAPAGPRAASGANDEGGGLLAIDPYHMVPCADVAQERRGSNTFWLACADSSKGPSAGTSPARAAAHPTGARRLPCVLKIDRGRPGAAWPGQPPGAALKPRPQGEDGLGEVADLAYNGEGNPFSCPNPVWNSWVLLPRQLRLSINKVTGARAPQLTGEAAKRLVGFHLDMAD